MDCSRTILSGHAIQRIFSRGLAQADILDVIRFGEVIEDYPHDTPYPSYLMLGFPHGSPLHVVVAKDDASNVCCSDGLYSTSGSLDLGLSEEAPVRCVICKHGQTQPGAATVVLQRGDTTVVIKDVPADICDTCAEYYLSEEISARVLALAEQAVAQGAEAEVLRFAA